MADKTLFKSYAGKWIPRTDARNEEGAPAYAFTPEHALAQYAATGCLNSTFYASGEQQLETVLALCRELDAGFIARAAVYCRETGLMKDMPALLCAVLSVKSPDLLARVFDRVLDNGRMLRNFVQIMRSGAVGRKSLGTRPKRLIQRWLDRRGDEALFRDSVGQDPSLADIIKMVHPRPDDAKRESFYGYLIGKQVDPAGLPELVRRYEEYKRTRCGEVPDVPFQKLTALDLGREQWTAVAMRAGWQMTRMNLNTFRRHGVFEDKAAVAAMAQRLRDPDMIARARVFPYQLMVAYLMAHPETPPVIRDALQEALELATANVPRVEGKVYVLPDVSGSMTGAAITGSRRGATSVVRCVDVAALLTASILRRNSDAEVLAFDHQVYEPRLNPRDSIMTNAEKLAGLGGGGTSCSAPLDLLNQREAVGDLVLYISDNQSWVDDSGRNDTATMREWSRFRVRNPQARMVCMDIQPYGTTQAVEREDILNIGGFSDAVFQVISTFAQGGLEPGHWVAEIRKVEL